MAAVAPKTFKKSLRFSTSTSPYPCDRLYRSPRGRQPWISHHRRAGVACGLILYFHRRPQFRRCAVGQLDRRIVAQNLHHLDHNAVIEFRSLAQRDRITHYHLHTGAEETHPRRRLGYIHVHANRLVRSSVLLFENGLIVAYIALTDASNSFSVNCTSVPRMQWQSDLAPCVFRAGKLLEQWIGLKQHRVRKHHNPACRRSCRCRCPQAPSDKSAPGQYPPRRQ